MEQPARLGTLTRGLRAGLIEALDPSGYRVAPGLFRPASRRQGERAMSPDTIAIVVVILGTGIALAVLIVPSLRELRRDVADLRERMARLDTP